MTALHVESVGSGRPLVLLHGWGMHAGFFTPLLPALAPRYRVHAVDLPGHGHSRAHAAADMDAMVAALRMRFAADGPALVLGWSFGGLLALHWAIAASAEVRALVLVAATPRFVQSADWPHGMEEETLRRFGDELAIGYRPTLQRFVALQLAGSDAARATLAAMRQDLFARGEPAREALAAGLDMLRTTDVRAALGSVRQPTLVVAGERDTLTPPGAALALAAAMPNARAVVIPGAAHVPFLSHRDAFVAALEAFDA